MKDSFEKLPVDGVSSVIVEGKIPDSVMDTVDFPEDDEELDEYAPEDEDGPQKFEQVTVASYSEVDGRVTVTYDDSEVLEMPETLTQITFTADEPGCVSIIRSGALSSMITVEEGKRNMGEYKFGPYSIPVSFYGRRVNNMVRDGVGVIELDYTVEMSGAGTSHTKMKLKLEKLPASPVKA